MLKIMINKEWLRFRHSVLLNKKTGKLRDSKEMASYTLLLVVLTACMMFSFGTIEGELCSVFSYLDMNWVYFAMVALMGTAIGVLTSGFSASNTIFKAKDNELLISMPVESKYIVIPRLASVWFTGLLYSSLIMIPAVAVFFITNGFNISVLAGSIVMIFAQSLIVTVLASIIGFVLALLGEKLKNKSYISLIIALIFLWLYYYYYSKMITALNRMVFDSQMGVEFAGKVQLLYHLGHAFEGGIISLVICLAIAAVLSIATSYVLIANFTRISTMKKGSKSAAAAKAISTKASGMNNALLRKEFKRFTGNANYMLNCGLGSVFCIAFSVYALIKLDDMRAAVSMFTADPAFSAWMVPVAALVVCFMSATNDITAPSISLEGKSISILQAMPVDPYNIFEAKWRLHMYVTVPGILASTVAMAAILQIDTYSAIMVFITASCYVSVTAYLGLILNLLMPNLTWSNEVVPIKQSLPVTIMLLGSWVILSAAAGICLVMSDKITPNNVLGVAIPVLVVLITLERKWLRTKGSEIFASL